MQTKFSEKIIKSLETDFQTTFSKPDKSRTSENFAEFVIESMDKKLENLSSQQKSRMGKPDMFYRSLKSSIIKSTQDIDWIRLPDNKTIYSNFLYRRGGEKTFYKLLQDVIYAYNKQDDLKPFETFCKELKYAMNSSALFKIDPEDVVKKIKECNIADFESTKALFLYIGKVKNKHEEQNGQQVDKFLFFPAIKPAPMVHMHGEYAFALVNLLCVLSYDLKKQSENVFNQLKVAHKEAKEALEKAEKEKAGPFIIKPLKIATICLNVEWLGFGFNKHFGIVIVEPEDVNTSSSGLPSPGF